MKKIIVGLVWAVFFLIGFLYLQHSIRKPYQGTTRITLSGTTGTVVVGYYMLDDQKVPLSNTVPANFTVTNISSFELRKHPTEETVVLGLHYDSAGSKASITKTLGPEMFGLRGKIHNGLIIETITITK